MKTTARWQALPLLLFLVVAFVLPVSVILVQGVWSSELGFNTAGLQRLVQAPVYARVMWRTLEISSYVTLCCVLLGYPLAYTIHRARRAQRATLYLLVLLPFWTSFMVKAFAWLVILGRNGPLNEVLTTLGGPLAARNLLFDTGAVLVGMVHGLLPFAVLSILPVLDALDPRLATAAASMGAGPLRSFTRVTLPLSTPGVAAAALITFVTALGFFIVPALLGGPQQTMAANLIIELVLDLVNWPLAGAAALCLLGAVGLWFGLYVRAFGVESLVGRARMLRATEARGSLGSGPWLGAGLSAAESLGRRWPGLHLRWLTPTVAWASVAFLAAPMLFLIPISVSDSGIIDWPPRGFSGQWYQALNTPAWREAALRSFGVAMATGALSLVLAFPAARWFVRHARRGRALALGFMLTPMVLPRVILAIGLFYMLARTPWMGSMASLVVGHTVIALPFVLVTLIAVLQSYDERLDAAAAVCGASPAQALRKVTLPLLAPGLASAYLFAFITSFDELTIALFLTGGLGSTIPKQMWDEASIKVSPTLAAASTLLFLTMSVLVLLAQSLRKK